MEQKTIKEKPSKHRNIKVNSTLVYTCTVHCSYMYSRAVIVDLKQ